jgi:sec-independent protein translocase protein TatA
MPIGIPELLVVLAIVLIIFGPKRLPSLGRQLGGGIRNFRQGIRGEGDDRPDLTKGPNAATRSDDQALDGEVVPEHRQ